MRILAVTLLLHSVIVSVNGTTCPMDLSYVRRLPWNRSSCQSFGQADREGCCQTLKLLLGVGLAQYLKDESMFELPDNATATACFGEFQRQLESVALSQDWIPACFNDTTPYIRSPSLCAGIQTKQDWLNRLGETPVDTYCKGDLSILAACNLCRDSGEKVLKRLVSLTAKSASVKCFYFTCLYAAGVVNKFGPQNVGTAACAFRLPLSRSQSDNHRVWLYVSVGAALVLLLLCISVIAYRLWATKGREAAHKQFVKRSRILLRAAVKPNTGTAWFDIEEIKEATRDFSEANLIGRGGFGTVYRGSLPDGQQIAVKKIRNCTSEGDSEFINEVQIINSIRHRNLVVLRGCSVASDDVEGHQRFLVYEYMPNGSLEDRMFGVNKPLLTWPDRQNIVLGTARGLSYLHDGVQPAIFHRDIKPSNILLDDQLNARVADFGLAKITTQGESHLITRIAGTHGYLAPEYALYGQLTSKSDVYSFGVVLLEAMSGRRALDPSVESASHYLITDWAWTLLKEDKTIEIIDPRIRHSGPRSIMERFVLVGILCSHIMVAFRPTIVEALKMLEGEYAIPEIPERPLPLTHEPLDCENDSFIISTSITHPSISSTEMLR